MELAELSEIEVRFSNKSYRILKKPKDFGQNTIKKNKKLKYNGGDSGDFKRTYMSESH